MLDNKSSVLWQRVAWYTCLAGLVVLLFSAWPHISRGLLFLHESPAFPLWKSSANSRPYSIGILNAIVYTAVRVLAGTALGFCAGTALGLCFSYFRYLGARLYTLLLILAPVAPLVWLPFALGAFGIGEVTTVLLVASGSVFVCGVVIYYLAENTRRALLDVAVVFGATKWQCMRYVVIPAMVPMLFLLLRVNFFAGWMAVLAAEMAGVEQGLGSMLILGRSLGNTPVITFAATTIAIVAVGFDRLLSLVAFHLIRRRYGAAVHARG